MRPHFVIKLEDGCYYNSSFEDQFSASYKTATKYDLKHIEKVSLWLCFIERITGQKAEIEKHVAEQIS